MDPNANLAEQRRIAERMLECADSDLGKGHGHGSCDCDADGERLAELVQALDGWISRGGFLPDAWRKA